jgi:predicted amidophosphoribosyltransferase
MTKTLYHARKAQGLCTNCGVPLTEVALTCPACRRRELSTFLARYQARKATRVCPECTAPVPDAQVFCLDCRASHAARQRARRQAARDETPGAPPS